MRQRQAPLIGCCGWLFVTLLNGRMIDRHRRLLTTMTVNHSKESFCFRLTAVFLIKTD